jgi:hypothetical protein
MQTLPLLFTSFFLEPEGIQWHLGCWRAHAGKEPKMNPEIANAIAGFANATNTLFDVLIRTLDQHRMIDKQRFRQTSY